MSAHGPSDAAAHELERDRQLVAATKNTARYFTEHRHVAWTALILCLAAGVFGYLRMPKAKDPLILVRMTVATCAWPGAEAEKIEQLVTRKIEQRLAESNHVEKVESVSRTGLSIVYVTLRDSEDRAAKLTDLQTRLDTIRDLPPGAGPIRFQKDYGDTATIMLTLASPKVSDVEIELRAAAIAKAVTRVRAGEQRGRLTLLLGFPPDAAPAVLDRMAASAQRYFASLSGVRDARLVRGPGFLGLDLATDLADDRLASALRGFGAAHLRLSELHPDVWPLTILRDPAEAAARLTASAGDRYTHRQLDTYSDLVQRYLQRLPDVARVTRAGVVPEQITLEYSQERVASYGLEVGKLSRLLAARNITAPGGVLEIGGKNVTVDPSGELADTDELGGVLLATSASGAPVYLRDLVTVHRDYVSPVRYLNTITLRGKDGALATHRAVTLAITMRTGTQIADFAAQVNRELATLRQLLPEDLIYSRTSDQPLQVEENVSLFLGSLYEAVALVVLVALIGFWEWRTALLLALSIPITLAMTFAMMYAWGIDLQQISIASLIIALGLLVDDPVVASDSIKQSIAAGWRPRIAAWLGPTKLARAIFFATITNIAAYLPFLTLTGDVGTFIYSLPIVLTMSLVASRVVSMTFIPLLGALLLRPRATAEPTASERRTRGFGRIYAAVVGWAIDHRKLAFVISLLLLGAGAFSTRGLRQAFFPKDLSYLSFIDVWLPEDAPLSETRARVEEVRAELAATAAQWAKEQGRDPKDVLASITSFIGGGGPRFWFSVAPEAPQLNYAQLLVQVKDKHDTAPLVGLFQERLSEKIAGARIDVRQLETGKPVGIPVAIRVSGEDIGQLRAYAARIKAVLRETPGALGVRDDWGNDTFSVKLQVDSDRANLAGVTNLDVATSSAAAMNGAVVGQLREGDREINIVTRLRAEERAQLGDVQDLYVLSQTSAQKVPLGQVSRLEYAFATEKIRRRGQVRTITVSCFPAPGVLPSEVLKTALPAIEKIGASFAPGYRYEIGGEKEERKKSMAQMAVVAVLLLLAIFVALVAQFHSAVKPLIVFAALPYGAVAAVASLVIAKTPMGFMAILGIISLMGVIVSHVIVLFDFIEEGHERGEPMRETLIDAGLMRLRPVMVTVIATVLGLIPLALHGGPLWEPLCYAQIGGLSFATLVTLVIVPVLYTIFIKDLKWLRWEHAPAEDTLTEPLVIPHASSAPQGPSYEHAGFAPAPYGAHPAQPYAPMDGVSAPRSYGSGQLPAESWTAPGLAEPTPQPWWQMPPGPRQGGQR